MPKIDPSITLATLADPVFLNLAARKAAKYILRHNSFCDRLEVARFMAHADANCKKISTDILTGRYHPSPSRYVPSPKKVIRTEDKTDYTVRNLAHVSFRDQVTFTALAVLFADQWETSWGNPMDGEFPALVSLGNRLALTWGHDAPHLSIGSSKLFRDWADDYPRFVKTTEDEFNKNLERLKKGERLALLSLDIRDFYPSIDRTELVRTLGSGMSDQRLLAFMRDAFASFPLERSQNSDELPLESDGVRGLPQGLAASGFLSNVYLSTLDEWVKERLEGSVESVASLKLLFYVRYVDDIRILIKYKSGLGPPRTSAAKHPVFQAVISHLGTMGLTVAGEKCGLIEVSGGQRRLTQGQLAERMQDLRKRVYLPLTPEDALEAGKDLEMLFATEMATFVRDRSTTDLDPLLLDGPGVRRGSRQRFAAGWWAHLWNDQLKFGYADWERRGRQFADVLVREWHDDPSQIRLLKIAIDIGATKQSTEIVWERLRELRAKKREWFNFILSDLLDHQAFRRRQLTTNRTHFLALRRYAISVVRTAEEPWYLKDKAACFLASIDLGFREQAKLREANWPASSLAFQVLQAILGNTNALQSLSPFEALSIIRALKIPPRKTSAVLRRLFLRFSPGQIETVLPAVSNALPDMALWLIRSRRARNVPPRLLRYYRDVSLENRGESTRLKVTGATPYLASLIQEGHYRHPVSHAKLAVDLLKLFSQSRELDIMAMQGMINPWNIVVQQGSLGWAKRRVPVDGYVGYPSGLNWIKPGMVIPPTWALPCGLILRVAATGKMRHLLGTTPGQRYGMWLDPSNLIKDGAQLEERMLNLISRMFAWPGTLSVPPKELTAELQEAEAIFSHQRDLSISSSTGAPGPALVGVSAPILSDDGRLTIAICQLDIPKLPGSDPEELKCRVAIRRALKMVVEHKRHLGARMPLNIIVFPELSIPPAGLSDLVRFAFQEGIVVVGGLSYEIVATPTGPKRFNRLAWIVPSDVLSPRTRNAYRRVSVLFQDKIHHRLLREV